MKKHHLIIITALLFVVLFYQQDRIGINISIIALFFIIFTWLKTAPNKRTRQFYFVGIASILSSAAFAWFGDFISFITMIASVFVLGLWSRARNMKPIWVIPTAIINGLVWIVRVFNFKQWFPSKKTQNGAQKIIAFAVIPFFFLCLFFIVYTHGSDGFAHLFSNLDLDVSWIQIVALALLGFFVGFNFWNFYVPRWIYKSNSLLENNFSNEVSLKQEPTFEFLELNFERISGVITFWTLNVMLLFFIVSFNYEQFFLISSKTPSQLSIDTHERVNAVILSIVMAILVIMFFFKSTFNFDNRAKKLKIAAQIWIILNGFLIFSAAFKNIEYVQNLGLTYKRLGVFTFLLLCAFGLILTSIKILKRKTNFFLLNGMVWGVFAILMLGSCINWGALITNYNRTKSNFDPYYHSRNIHFNQKILLEVASQNKDEVLRKEVMETIQYQKPKAIFSKVLFYENF